MKTIWNYVVPVDDKGRKHLCHDTVLPMVEVAWDEPTASPAMMFALRFWTMHEDNEDTHNWEFRVFGTGHPIPDNFEYVGTAPRTASNLIWHLFRRRI